NGISINDAAAYGVIRDVTFGADVSGSGVQHVTQSDSFRISGCSLVDSAAGRIETLSKTVPVIASAATLALNQYHDVLTVSGTTGITAIDSARRSVGSVVVLRFSSGLTLTNSASLVLSGGVNATPGANDIMTFAYFGNGTWRETARNF
ncbi:MAG TPA: hypothetical protein VFM75_02070, partial [Modicisalibacter sp.]|nr:hypothetical protein [Modicisalibacter sp.]